MWCSPRGLTRAPNDSGVYWGREGKSERSPQLSSSLLDSREPQLSSTAHTLRLLYLVHRRCEFINGGGNELRGFVHLGLGGVLADREADGTAGILEGHRHRRQDDRDFRAIVRMACGALEMHTQQNRRMRTSNVLPPRNNKKYMQGNARKCEGKDNN